MDEDKGEKELPNHGKTSPLLVCDACTNCGHHGDEFRLVEVVAGGRTIYPSECPVCGHIGSITQGVWGI